MAASDYAGPMKNATGSLVLSNGGAETLTVPFQQGSLTWTENGRQWTEARSRDRHESTPWAVETGDNNVEGTFTCLADTLLGNTSVGVKEFVQFTGGASGYTSTGNGSKKMFQLVATFNSTEDGGGSQTSTFAYCVADSVSFTPDGTDGLFSLEISFIDLENNPTIA